MQFDNLDLVILKTLTTNKRYALDFVNGCNEKLFNIDLWKFSKLVVDHIKTYKDTPTKRLLLERSKNAEYVSEIFNKLDAIQYDEREFKVDLEKLKSRFSDKLLSGLKDSLNNSSDLKKSVSEIQSTLNAIKGVNQPKIFKEGSLKDYANDFKNLYIAKMQNPDFGVGMKTGYSFIDYATGGLKKSELLLFAGITSSGKSLLLMNTAIQMWMADNTIDMAPPHKPGYNVLLFSLEMNYEDYMQRALARIAMVPQKSIRDASLSKEEQERVAKALSFIKRYNHSFKVVDLPRKATTEAIEQIIDEETEKDCKPDIIVVDYLNLMDADVGKDASDWLIQSSISSGLHELARVKEVLVLSAVQLNPKSMVDGKGDSVEASIRGFRRATAIADDCDMIIGINTRKGEKNYPDFSCSFLKNRRGELLDAKLDKNFACCALLDKRIEAENPDDISSIVGN